MSLIRLVVGQIEEISKKSRRKPRTRKKGVKKGPVSVPDVLEERKSPESLQKVQFKIFM